jgi:enoyl-[acyl-carrier protein] reductase I
MPARGCLLTAALYRAERVVPNCNLIGPAKAALESAARYIAAEVGPKRIRANAISPGPIRTRAGSGIAHFNELLAAEAAAAPRHQLVETEDVGALAAFLVSDGARRITGTIIRVDGGQGAIA